MRTIEKEFSQCVHWKVTEPVQEPGQMCANVNPRASRSACTASEVLSLVQLTNSSKATL
jgi:hypothetical protein